MPGLGREVRLAGRFAGLGQEAVAGQQVEQSQAGKASPDLPEELPAACDRRGSGWE